MLPMDVCLHFRSLWRPSRTQLNINTKAQYHVEKTCIIDCLLLDVGTLFSCSREREINVRPANQLF